MNDIAESKKNLYEIFKKEKLFSVKKTIYFPIYERCLNKYIGKKITLVEIGVADGGSLLMWKEYFGNQARIIGIDANTSAKKIEKYGVEIFIGDQSDPLFWKEFYKKIGNIDVLIDDGGHTNRQQIITVDSSINFINDNGSIIIEDIETSYIREFGNPSKYSFINFCIKKVHNLTLRDADFSNLKSKYTQSIYSIYFFDSIVCFNIDKTKCIISNYEDNRGTHAESFQEMRNITSYFGHWLNLRDILLKYFKFLIHLRKIFNFKFIQIVIFKYENYTLKKYFKE